MTKFAKFRSWILRSILVLVVIGLIGSWFGARWEQSEQLAFLESNISAPGQMIQVGSRELHIVAKGKGEASVLFITGLGDNYMSYERVQNDVSNAAFTVSYDRPGLGWSPISEDALSLDSAVQDIYNLISKPDLFATPPILVGHSLGGAIARRFAYKHPNAVSGLILLDPTPISDFPSLMHTLIATHMWFSSITGSIGLTRQGLYSRNADVTQDKQRLWAHLYASGIHARQVQREYQDTLGSDAILPTKDGLGDIPLTVLVAPAEVPPGFGDAATVLDSAKRRFAIESTLGRHIDVNTRHYIHYDDPDLVVAEILKMIETNSVSHK